MDLDSISQAVIFPTTDGMIQQVTDPEASVALCRVINDRLADYCREDPKRLFGIGVLPQTSAELALAEAKRGSRPRLPRRMVRPERIPGTPALQVLN